TRDHRAPLHLHQRQHHRGDARQSARSHAFAGLAMSALPHERLEQTTSAPEIATSQNGTGDQPPAPDPQHLDIVDEVAGEELRPVEVVRRLDEYIIGQGDAKKSVAIALRNRIRRQQLSDELRREVLPKNILMIGPTGVGKTEIARRVARLTASPFIKVEATKFTEVGYVGRDVESIVRDLLEQTITEVHD